MDRLFLLLLVVIHQVSSFMVMDEASCVEVEEEDCGIYHTIYMEECKMKMVEEMIPTKVAICRNITRSVCIWYFDGII